MKLTIEKNLVIAHAETADENLILVALTQPKPKAVRRHKKHQYVKQCPHCLQSCKGNVGLGIHIAKKHPEQQQ
jgi:hypothetical protein